MTQDRRVQSQDLRLRTWHKQTHGLRTSHAKPIPCPPPPSRPPDLCTHEETQVLKSAPNRRSSHQVESGSAQFVFSCASSCLCPVPAWCPLGIRKWTGVCACLGLPTPTRYSGPPVSVTSSLARLSSWVRTGQEEMKCSQCQSHT